MSGDEGTGGHPPTGSDAPGELSAEVVARLRSRAEQLQARRLPPPATPAAGPRAEPDDGPAPEPGPEADAGDDPFHDVAVDPETELLLDRWAEEARDEAREPRRNWSPVIAVLVVLAVIAAAGFGARALISGSADEETADDLAGGPDDAPSVLGGEAPSLEDLTSDVTLPPGPKRPLEVAAQGITVVPDRFDESRREGTYAVIVQNPHSRWLAQGVQVTVTFLDEAGAPVGEDSGFVEVVLPDQRVAVASLFFDAPTVPLSGMSVAIDVARWRETGPIEGGFTISEVQTDEAEFSGVRTRFQIQSGFDEVLTDVGITAVYKAADGRIIGGYDTFVERLEPGVPTPAEIALLANVDPAAISATELYPTAAFGSVPD